ncbi:MAG: hypothetical protein ACD_13C00289G0004 [uncultured bacterium]|uniref:Uncharacterized protein n=2 Tax=Katanobacteria TaxID=422282 RepID=A0A0G1GVN0_UNCKA|nr:MAG: hypothetical protein ACD_13C00289G0004 [uncultured bacterium]KKT11437.1 MAG: hypothetical protein UV89_C0014G0006 [candidate division WWE3 bacterium GW2011_GWB2_43_22]OGC59153.1 MAG: hypothetical protein A2245_03775 [candidate division WWE3 bacterium RIFOXYA2_FULL_43_12]OGC66841.1 MAG: hypothetical protein A2274_03100 [candidate division WWE3 bacterium RIFOXYA12_FULL_43_11]OGC72418.1 MAG: hypothetical protein A2337_02680 [candidate division WWE3 bacterium RIFOXYB2_FULL_43_9]OGC73722.1 
MYEFWIEVGEQDPQSVSKDAQRKIQDWGAIRTRSENLNGPQYAFKSSKDPRRLLGDLERKGDILHWGFFFESQLTKPRRKPTKTPGADEKAKLFAKLHERFGKTLGGKP